MTHTGRTLIALIAVLLTLVFLWQANKVVPPKETSWKDVLSEAEAGGYHIISTTELADQYLENRSDILIVDTRQEWEYRTGHIKGARNFPMEPTWWSRWRKLDELESFLGSDKNRQIVFY